MLSIAKSGLASRALSDVPALATADRLADLGPEHADAAEEGRRKRVQARCSPSPSNATELARGDVREVRGMAHNIRRELALQSLEAPPQVPWGAWADAASRDYLDNLVPQKLPGDVDLPSMVAVLHKHLPANAVLTNGAGNYASWTHRFFMHHGLANGFKTQLAPTGGAMGYGVPAGMAAAITTGRTVVTLTGDGDFVMSMGELATAAQYGVKTIMLVLNNGMYGSIRMHQERHFPGRVSGSDLRNPDFAALAETFGLAGARVSCTADFEPAFLAALNRECSTVIEVTLDPQALTTRASLDEIRARARAAGH